MTRRFVPCVIVLLLVFLLAPVASAGTNVQGWPQPNLPDNAVIAPNQGTPTTGAPTPGGSSNAPVTPPVGKKRLVSNISCKYTIVPSSPKAGDLVQPIKVTITNTGTVPFVEHAADFNCIGCGFDMSCPTCKDLTSGTFTAGVKAFSKQWTVPLLAPGAANSFVFNPAKTATGAPATYTPGPYIFSCYPNISNKDKVEMKNFEVKVP